MKVSVGIDFDSVICNIEDELVSYIRKNWYSDFKLDDLYEFDFFKNKYFDTKIANDLTRIVKDKTFLYSGLPYVGVVDAMSKLNEFFDVYVVTARYKNESNIVTNSWLDNFGIAYKNVFFTDGGEKYPVVEALDIKYFVEDNPYIIQTLMGLCKVYCVIRPWNRYFNDPRVKRVGSLVDAVTEIFKDGGIDYE